MVLDRIGDVFEYDGKQYVVGDQVMANDETEYSGLYGVITEIRDGDDKDTENDTPDIYCSFDYPDDPVKIAEIEAIFSDLYMCNKNIEDISLDLVIMAPEEIDNLYDNY